MVQKRKKGKGTVQEKTNTIQTNSEIQEFYLMEKLYQAMREDKKRGKRPSAKEFYLMERLYQAMINDKNRNQKLLNSKI